MGTEKAVGKILDTAKFVNSSSWERVAPSGTPCPLLIYSPSRTNFMTDGFLGYKTSLMLDVVVCALIVVVPTLLFSLYAVKIRRNYSLHKALQITLGIVLLAAVGLFEIDMRLHGGIEGILAKRLRPFSD